MIDKSGKLGDTTTLNMKLMRELNRRNLLKYGGAAVAVHAIPASRLDAIGFIHSEGNNQSFLQEDRIKELSKKAVDAALAAGATYADARLTYSKKMKYVWNSQFPIRSESIGIGVRSLSGGYWGFAASPIWNEVEASRLGKAATENANANQSKLSTPVELSKLDSPTSGSWVMPIKSDPFEVPFEEITDYLTGLMSFITFLDKVDPRSVRLEAESQVQDKYFFSSQNQAIHQRLYNTEASISFGVVDQTSRQGAGVNIDSLSPAGMGIELFKNISIRDYIQQKHQEALEEMELSSLPVDVGRYQVLMNRSMVANLTSQSIGLSTELDRALGYEANAGGTSFINSPEDMLGTLTLASPLVNISASRSGEGSVGRVEWDDEGVKPVPLNLIKDGKLVALQAPREGYSWLKEYHAKNNTQFVANGSVNSASGIDSPLVFSSDLEIEPDNNKSPSIDDLRSEIKDGIEFKSGRVSMDFQMSTGLGIGSAFKVVDGKRVARLINTGTIFRTTDLWKNVTAIGRKEDVMRFGFALNKGEPDQTCYHSVYAPHMLVKDMDIIDASRKA